MTTPELPSWATLVRAPNPGPMTLDGTNTYVLRAAGRDDCVVVDPGPSDPGHLERVAAHGPVALVLLTHGHPDHAEGAPAFARLTGAPLLAADPTAVSGADALADDVVAAGLSIMVARTPGHTSDSVSFVVVADALDNALDADDAEPAVLTGDTILGRGSTVVAHPDGVLADYLRSLERLRGLGAMRLLPGHGPVRPDVSLVAADYLRHRAERLEQVRAALDSGATTPREVVEVVYADVDRALWPAAEQSVRAQLDYLRG